jgi:signal peptidase I
VSLPGGQGSKAERVPAAGAPARTKSVFREYVEALLVALALALFIRTFFVQAFKIPSGSMLPTLQIGDHLLVNKLLYGIRVPVYGTRYFSYFKPEHGDIIVFVYPEDPDKDFIKRVIGIPGDRIEIRHKKLYRNGEAVDEPYAHFTDPEGPAPRDNFGPVTVPEGHVFVMGDNRDHSFDSRFWGFVPFEAIKGKAFVIYMSLDSEDGWANWIRWSRLGSLVH